MWAVIDSLTDRQLLPAPTDDYEARGWWTCAWSSEDPPHAIRVDHAPRKEVEGAMLKEEFKALGEPAGGDLKDLLSIEEWSAISGFEEPSPWARCYAVLTCLIPVPSTVVDDVLTLRPGRPRPAGAPTYRASLPNSLRYETRYVHLFPGYLDGFHEAAKARLEGLTDLSVQLYIHGTPSSIYVKVPGGVGYVFSDDAFYLPTRIDGDDLEDATKKWEAALDEIEQRVRTASQVCQHCKGTGRPPEWDEAKKKCRKR